MKNRLNLLPFTLLIAVTIISCEIAGSKTDKQPVHQQDTAIDFRGESYDWNYHSPPYDFLFGNHFDTHQQTKQSSRNNLNGFFYITINGEKDGIPVANHGNCDQNPDGCTVGWTLHGIKMEAELLQTGMGHPQWYISSDKMPRQQGYTHFHWIKKKNHGNGAGHHGSNSGGHQGGLEIGATYEGYLLKLTARETFYFDHHGMFFVTPGIDYETHANVQTEK